MLPDGNYLVCSLDCRYSYDELKQFDFAASATTGVDHIDARDIPLISLKGDPFLREVYATAEHTFALILSLLRKVPAAHKYVCDYGWDRELFRGEELHGKTLGIVGYGRVGRQVAEIAKGFGMNVLWTDLSSLEYDRIDVFYPKNDGESEAYPTVLLADSDILTVHVDLNDTTRKMFGPNEFSQMKSTAHFVNTSRGAVVNEDALFDALRFGKIAGAALDVLSTEPYIHEGLREYAKTHGNLILTPHLGGNTQESREKTQVHMAEKITEFIRGEMDVHKTAIP